MFNFRKSRTMVTIAALICTALLPVAQACTSLLYRDAHGGTYAGRTMELPMELPYKVIYIPKGTKFGSQADKHSDILMMDLADVTTTTINGTLALFTAGANR
ncbi:MAG: linear amide C-N hydrolase [Oceanicaulis sp.]|nr:linear amide C-N hydrolase [Oceanicaulis sp.]